MSIRDNHRYSHDVIAVEDGHVLTFLDGRTITVTDMVPVVAGTRIYCTQRVKDELIRMAEEEIRGYRGVRH